MKPSFSDACHLKHEWFIYLLLLFVLNLFPLRPLRFQAYGSGCDVVILASDFDCVQIIPGAQNGNIQVGCVECSHQLGRVSVDCTVGRAPTHSFSFSVQSEDIINYAEHKAAHLAAFARLAILLSCTTPNLPLSCGNDCADALTG